VGGTHAIFDTAIEHLRATRRAKDPHQQHRLGQMATEIASGYAWLDYAAANWAGIEHRSSKTLIACMCAARGAIERAALNVLELARPKTKERLNRGAGNAVPRRNAILRCFAFAIHTIVAAKFRGIAIRK
jgi:hypothetical protein